LRNIKKYMKMLQILLLKRTTKITAYESSTSKYFYINNEKIKRKIDKAFIVGR
jgi:hypothetical protein